MREDITITSGKFQEPPGTMALHLLQPVVRERLGGCHWRLEREEAETRNSSACACGQCGQQGLNFTQGLLRSFGCSLGDVH